MEKDEMFDSLAKARARKTNSARRRPAMPAFETPFTPPPAGASDAPRYSAPVPSSSSIKSQKTAFAGIAGFLSRMAVYLLVFLSPFFFLPWVSNSVYLGKQFLAACLLSAAVLFFAVKILSSGESFSYASSGGGVLLVILTAISGVSAYFSGARNLSFWGFGGSEPFAGLSMILLLFFYFLALVYFLDAKIRSRAIMLFGAGSGILFLVSAISILGTGFFKVDFLIKLLGSGGWNPFGTPNALALFAAMVFAYSAGLVAMGGARPVPGRRLWQANILLALFLMLSVGYPLAYLVSALSMILLLCVSFSRHRGEFIRRSNFILLGTVLFLGLFLLRISLASLLSFPAEVGPNVRLSFQIGSSVMTENAKNFIIGSGPSTFAYDYARYRPDALNQTGLWNVRFTSGYAALATLMAELGLLGVLVMVVFLLFHIIRFIKAGLSSDADDAPQMTAALLGTFAGAVAFATYPISFVSLLYLVFFIAAGNAVVAHLPGRSKEFSFTSMPHRALLISLGLVCLLLGSFFLFLTSARHIAGEIYYSSAVRAYGKQDAQKSFGYFTKALQWYDDDEYSRTYALAFIDFILRDIQDGKKDPAVVQTGFQNAIAMAQRATTANPKERENWLALGTVYERLIGIAKGAETAALEAYKKMEALEPGNPLAYLAQGRTALAAAQSIQSAIAASEGKEGVDQKALDEAKKNKDAFVSQAREQLKKAQEKKENLEAVYLLNAQLEEFLGDRTKAIEQIIVARRLNPGNLDSLFTLGRLSYEDGQFESARIAFENVVKAIPSHQTGLFYLALAYAKTDMRDKALETIRGLAELAPDNKTVQEVKANLEAGKDALGAALPPVDQEVEPAPQKR